MNREQKTAWFILILSVASLAGFFVMSSFSGWRFGLAAFSLLGLMGLTPFLFRRHTSPEVPADERDHQIGLKATMMGGLASYLAFVLGLMIVWAIQRGGGHASVSIDVLPLLVFCGWLSFSVFRSAILLILYRIGGGYAE